MPLPPLRSLLSSARAAADRYVTEPIIAAAAHYPPSRPSPAPLDWRGVIHDCGTGIIEQITDPASLPALSEQRAKLIADSDGARSMTIVRKEVGAQLRPGQLTSAILSVMERNQWQGYRLLLG
jgi:hypothetical protein